MDASDESVDVGCVGVRHRSRGVWWGVRGYHTHLEGHRKPLLHPGAGSCLKERHRYKISER